MRCLYLKKKKFDLGRLIFVERHVCDFFFSDGGSLRRGFGLPQRRRRVFVVASLHGDPRDVILSQNGRCHGGQCTSAKGARRRFSQLFYPNLVPILFSFFFYTPFCVFFFPTLPLPLSDSSTVRVCVCVCMC